MSGRIITLSLLALGLWGQTIDINTGTKGTLNINRGGTGATSAAQALTNLGGIGASTSDTLTNKTLSNPRINAILDPSNGSVVVQILSTGGATEGLSVTPSLAGNPVIVSTFGSGANVDLTLDPKGTGLLRMPGVDEVFYPDGSVGQFQRKAANGRMEWATISGTGTVTSVGLNGIVNFITVSGSPVTTAGSFSLSLNSQVQNSVFAGPTSGSGTPGFRALVAGDIPSLDASKTTSGTFDPSRIVSGGVVNNRCLEINGSAQIVAASAACNTGGGSGVTSLNSQTGVVTITDGAAGNDFSINSAAGFITINLPTASSSKRGLLSSSDWTTFNNKVSGPGSSTVGDLPAWSNTGGTALGAGVGYSNLAVANKLVMRDSQGSIEASNVSAGFGIVQGGHITGYPGSDQAAGSFYRFSSTQTNVIARFRTELGVDLSTIDKDGNFTGRSNTTLAFAANPTNCDPGQATRGIAANGNAEDCFTPAGGSNSMALYNVKDAPYNAVGNGINDDTTEIQAAIDACQNSSRGGIVYFPPGIYAISSGLWYGNGSTSGVENPSTKAVCRFEGAGAADDPVATNGANVNTSTILWTGSNPGSLTYILTIDGPVVGTGISHLKVDGNSNSNVVGLDLRHVNYSHFSDVVVSRTGGGTSGGAFAVKIWPQKTFGIYACFNTIENMRVRPYSDSVGSALWVGGNSSFGTACSINVYGGYFNRDNNYTSGTNTATYGVLLDSSDNFHAAFTHFSSTGGNGARNGCSIGATPGAFSGAGVGTYPDSAHFYGISSGGMCGQTGASTRPFVVWGGECAADGQGSCDYHNAFTGGGGVRPVSLSGEADAALKGVKRLSIRNGDGSGARYFDVISTTGTTLFTMERGGVTGAGIDFNAFNEVRFLNPSFFEAQLKIRPSVSNDPGTCTATNEGWLWVKQASPGVTATTLTMCAANSAGTFAWRTVQSF